MVIGRRGGKSRNAALCAVYLACRQDYAPLLAPGETAVIPIIAAEKKQARQVLSFLKGIARRFPPPIDAPCSNSSTPSSRRAGAPGGSGALERPRGREWARPWAESGPRTSARTDICPLACTPRNSAKVGAT